MIVFDMNETLLDLSSLDPAFAQIFSHADGAELRTAWFRQLLELFLTATITGAYRSFDKLSDDALQLLKGQRGSEASADDRATRVAPRALHDSVGWAVRQTGVARQQQTRAAIFRWSPVLASGCPATAAGTD